MKVWVYKVVSILLSALVGLASTNSAFAQGKWRYVPKALKTPRVPAVLNPKLPLQTRVKLARLSPVLDAAVTRATLSNVPANTPVAPVYPPRFASFLSWMDTFSEKRLIAPTPATRQAITYLREGMINYDQLPPSQQAQLNLWMITLDRLRLKLGVSKSGSFYRLVYHADPTAGLLPKLENMHLQVKKSGLAFSKMSQIQHLGITSLYLAQDHQRRNNVKGFTFVPGATVQTAQREFAQVIKAVLPDEYRLRIDVHELGLVKGDRSHFRQGFLHLHFEKINARTEILPVDESIELWLSCKPFAGVVNPITRKLIVPFDDKKIAQNYLTLFGDYLSLRAKQELLDIIYGQTPLEKLPIEPDEPANEN